jgi:hypothetical protein
MTPLTPLWLPILLSAVLVFVASSVIHMVIGWHRADYPPLPDEARFGDAFRPLDIPPGDYFIPCPRSAADARSPEFLEKRKRGPVVMMTVFPAGESGMGRSLALWFAYIVVVGLFAAYVTSRAVPPGTDYLQVFRFVGTVAFIGYSLALWQMSIWYRRAWGTTIRSTIDGLIYAGLTAGVFGWLWPK